MPLRLGESQPGDLQNQLSAALAYIKQLESGQVAAGAPAEPSKLQRATPLEVLGNTFIIYLYIYINKCVGICIYLCCYSY